MLLNVLLVFLNNSMRERQGDMYLPSAPIKIWFDSNRVVTIDRRNANICLSVFSWREKNWGLLLINIKYGDKKGEWQRTKSFDAYWKIMFLTSTRILTLIRLLFCGSLSKGAQTMCKVPEAQYCRNASEMSLDSFVLTRTLEWTKSFHVSWCVRMQTYSLSRLLGNLLIWLAKKVTRTHPLGTLIQDFHFPIIQRYRSTFR